MNNYIIIDINHFIPVAAVVIVLYAQNLVVHETCYICPSPAYDL